MRPPVTVTTTSWAGKGAVAVLAAAIAFAAGQPAHAQSAEPSSGARHGGTALVNQVEMLKQQNRDLLGQVETLQHQINQLKEINKEQYLALDARIKRLEKAPSSGSAAEAAAETPDETGGQATAASAAAAASAGGETASAASSTAPAASASTALASDEDAQQAYDAAFDALRAGDFVTSSRGFRQFTRQYPHDKLTPNAWYWLGESYYITQNYEQALAAFAKVLSDFPDSAKAPGALLKKGYSQYALKDIDKAEATLMSVIKRYPDSASARLAKQRLEDIRLQQQLN